MSLKEIAKFVPSAVFAGMLRVRRQEPQRVILYYHGIRKEQIRSFERQMAHLAACYRVVPASRIRTVVPEDGLPLVALTFDDALVSVFDWVVPILLRHGFAATLCAPTGRLGGPPAWDMEDGCAECDDCVMTEQQVGRLDELGFEWFSHGVSHAPLTQVSEAEIRRELVESKRRLEQILGHEVTGISYPYGACDDRVARHAREAGYRLGLTIEPVFAGEAADELLVGRTCVSGGDGLPTFRLKASGAYKAVAYLSRGKRLLLQRPARGRNPSGPSLSRSLLQSGRSRR
jgi:peptidoglycan/xylan/chitin deacetylase (PgdA/CDA1 family)